MPLFPDFKFCLSLKRIKDDLDLKKKRKESKREIIFSSNNKKNQCGKIDRNNLSVIEKNRS